MPAKASNLNLHFTFYKVSLLINLLDNQLYNQFLLPVVSHGSSEMYAYGVIMFTKDSTKSCYQTRKVSPL